MMALHKGPGRAVFLDRDGTVMHDVHYCRDPQDVKVFPGAAAALRRLKEHGFKLIIVTNQSGIGRGYFTEEMYHAVYHELLGQLGDGLIDGAYFCPDAPDTGSKRRKPSPEMVFEAQRDHDLDLARSFFIGDKAIDVGCGKAAGARTILLRTGSVATDGENAPEWIARDLAEAAEIILAHADE